MTRQITSRNPTSRNPTTYNPVRQPDKIKDPREIFGSALVLYNDARPMLVNGRPNLYQEFGGVTPATTAGHPIGLVLDLHDLSRWGEVVPTLALNDGAWSGSELNRWTFTSNTAAWANNGAQGGINTTFNWYPSGYKVPIELSYTVSGYSGYGGGGIQFYPLRLFPDSSTAINTLVAANGTYKFMGYWREVGNPSYLYLYGAATNNFTLSDITAKRIDGNHAHQASNAQRPILQQDSIGFYAYYNGSGHRLDAYFLTAPGANCTQYKVGLSSVTRTDGLSIGAGVVTLNNQREDIRAHVIVNRAPTAEEDAKIRLWISANFGGIV